MTGSLSLTEYEKALVALEEALKFASTCSEPVLFKIARDASIQRFEFCVGLAWKSSARVLGSSSTTARPVIREMAQNGLIDSTSHWFEYIEARNKSSHTYKEEIARQVFDVAQSFLPRARDLLEALRLK